ncbi:hypothetical protein ACFLR7_04870 [Acidobacteriota bacterium]
MNKITENSLRFPDGRRLYYAEYDDPNGKLIFAFHEELGQGGMETVSRFIDKKLDEEVAY